MTTPVQAPPTDGGSPMGREVDRVEARQKVTGAARYAADLRPAGLLYGHLVLSTIGVGRVLSMDVGGASRLRGVVAVYTPFSPLPQYLGEEEPGENYVPLQDNLVRFRGQIIGMVVAETSEVARDAAALVSATYREGTPRTSLAAGLPGRAREDEDPEGPQSTATVLAPGVPSMEAAFAASEVVVRRTFTHAVQNHAAMEPHATTAVWDGDHVTVYTGAQVPQAQAATIATRLGVEPEQVRLLCDFTGGAFGSRVLVWSDGALAAAAARTLGRPVQLTLTREQTFAVVAHRSAIVQTVELGASSRGRLNALRHESSSELPAVGGWAMSPAQDMSTASYPTPNLQIDQRDVELDTGPVWAMRGPNETPGSFALETTMDELAVTLDMDPLELRRRNMAETAPLTGLPFSSKHLDECYTRGAERFGWAQRPERPGSRLDGDWLVGMGMASAVYPGTREGGSARVAFRHDGTVRVASATADMGTGALTVLAIAGADALGLPLRQVVADQGDSALPPGAAPAYGSGSTLNTVPAVQRAARQAERSLLRVAVSDRRSPFFGLAPELVRYERGLVIAGDQSRPFGSLLRQLGRRVVGSTTDAPPGDEVERYAFYSFGAHFCEVGVHRLTGEVHVRRITSVVDVGRVVNAKALRSQLVGGIIFGIGAALLEDNPLESNGRFAHGNLAEYLVPVNADAPDIDVSWLDRPDPVISAFGGRGAGEIGTVGTPAAIGNAVFNATGRRVLSMPITLDELFSTGGRT